MLTFVLENILTISALIFAACILLYVLLTKKGALPIALSVFNVLVILVLFLVTAHSHILLSVFSIRIDSAILYYAGSFTRLYCSCFFFYSTIYLLFSRAKISGIKSHYDMFISSLEKNKWNIYYFVDKKDRIREISDGLLQELGMERDSVLGKKAFDVFDSSVRFTLMNDTETNNKELREMYKNHEVAVPNNTEIKREFYVKNHLGQTIVLSVIEQGLYNGNSYQGRITIGQKKNDEVMTRVEHNLKESNSDLDMIKSKFIASLELTEESVFFFDSSTSSFWGNDNWVKQLGLPKNDISLMDYKGFIASEDLEFYNKKINELTPENPYYEMRYKFKVGSFYRFVFEHGKKIFSNDGDSIIGYVKVNSGNFFEYTGYKEIDSLEPLENLNVDVDNLFKQNKMFELVCISLTNIPEINKRFGRQTGNLIMAEYLKNLSNNFLTASSKIYRASGLIFYVTLTDVRKMELLHSCLAQNDKAMNLNAEFGANKITLEVNIGIADSFTDGANKTELINNCNTSINTAINPQYHSNYVYYKDIKEYL